MSGENISQEFRLKNIDQSRIKNWNATSDCRN